MTTRHEFLTLLHELVQPEVYLEVGVQHGWSLQLSQASVSIGIDPNPLLQVKLPHQSICTMTSDEYFRQLNADPALDRAFDSIDLAFIDGMHLIENALRDFANIEKLSHDRTVIVFDDVLPTTVEMAARTQCPGDWTGDVWRVYDILREWRPDLVLVLVDTQPTGLLVVLRPNMLSTRLNDALKMFDLILPNPEVPDYILNRHHALDSDLAIEQITRWRNR